MCGLQKDLYPVKKDKKMKKILMTAVLTISSATALAQLHLVPQLKDLSWQMAPSIGKIGDKGEFKLDTCKGLRWSKVRLYQRIYIGKVND